MNVYHRHPDGSLGMYQADTSDHLEAINAVHNELDQQVWPILAVIDGSKTAPQPVQSQP